MIAHLFMFDWFCLILIKTFFLNVFFFFAYVYFLAQNANSACNKIVSDHKLAIA